MKNIIEKIIKNFIQKGKVLLLVILGIILSFIEFGWIFPWLMNAKSDVLFLMACISIAAYIESMTFTIKKIIKEL